MSIKSPNYSAILDNEATRIVNDLAEIRGLLDHNPSLGSAVEQTIVRMLQKFLPDSYEITSGFAVDTGGTLSPQQDILVVRKHQIGPLSTYAGFGVYPIEHILAAIEVKTILTISELQSAMNTLEQLVSLSPEIPGEGSISKQPGNLIRENIPICPPFTAIFGLETDIAIGRILYESRRHSSNTKITTRLNAVHVLGQSITCWIDKSGVTYPKLVLDPQAKNVEGVDFDWEGRRLEISTSAANENESLKAFLSLLLGFLAWYSPPPINLQKYLLAGLRLEFDVEPKPPRDEAQISCPTH